MKSVNQIMEEFYIFRLVDEDDKRFNEYHCYYEIDEIKSALKEEGYKLKDYKMCRDDVVLIIKERNIKPIKEEKWILWNRDMK